MRQALFFLLFLSLTATTLGLIKLALAQSENPPALSSNALLEQRFKLCMGNPACTTKQQIQLMDDMAANMLEALGYIRQGCISKQYKNCVGPRMSEVLQWHNVHDHMRDIMLALESQYAASIPDTPGQVSKKTGRQLNLVAPAAGPTPNRYTNPDQEKLERQKQQWWQGWGPREENNPYRKW